MEPLRFRLTSAHLADETYVVTLAGELDLANSRELDDALRSLTSDSARRVIVDLLEVPFLESTTLGVLLRHARRLRMGEGELTIVSDDVRVLRVFEITGLGANFRFERTLAAAVEDVFAAAVP